MVKGYFSGLVFLLLSWCLWFVSIRGYRGWHQNFQQTREQSSTSFPSNSQLEAIKTPSSTPKFQTILPHTSRYQYTQSPFHVHSVTNTQLKSCLTHGNMENYCLSVEFTLGFCNTGRSYKVEIIMGLSHKTQAVKHVQQESGGANMLWSLLNSPPRSAIKGSQPELCCFSQQFKLLPQPRCCLLNTHY